MLYKKFISILGLAALVLFGFAPLAHAAAPVDHISLSPMSASVVAGENVDWTVTAHRTDGTSSDVTASASFSIADEAGGAFTDATYISEHAGMWEITASLGSFEDSAMLYVVHGSSTALTLTVDTTTATADDVLTFTSVLSDAHGNAWDATGQTTFSTNEEGGTFVANMYELQKTGNFTVTAKIAGLTETLPISVTPGSPASIMVVPSGDFTIEVDTIRDISATLLDADGNKITAAEPGLTLTGDAANFTDDGKIKGVKAGAGTFAASFEDLKKEVTYTVTAPEPAPVQEETTQGQVLGESVEGDNQETAEPAEESEEPFGDLMSEEEQDEATNEECTETELWVALVVLAGYAVLLIGYYALIRKDDDKTWWIFPVLLTAIGIIIWSKYFCENTYIWWPWILVLLGIFITWYGRGPMKKEGSSDSDVPPGGPTDTEGQKPMF